MNDKIYIRDLLVYANIGVEEPERTHVQPLIINIELALDLTKAGQSDHIHDTVNYQTVIERVLELIQQSRCRLLEKLAVMIAELILRDFNTAEVKIRIDKNSVSPVAKAVGVEIIRKGIIC